MTIQQTRVGRIAILVTIILFIPIFIDLFTTRNELELDDFVFKHLWIPIILFGIATGVLMFGLKEEYYNILNGTDKRIISRLKLVGLIIITTPGLMLLYFALLKSILGLTNRYIGHQDQIVLEGRIEGKDAFESRGKTRYYFEIDSKSIERKVEISVDPLTYRSHNVGDTYSENIYKGSLGFLYKLR